MVIEGLPARIDGDGYRRGSGTTVYDVAVIGAGPAGVQAAISAAHQMRHVLVLDAGQVSNRKGRAYWSKSVPIEDAPVFPGITGPKFVKALHDWLRSRPVQPYTLRGETRLSGIELRGGMVLELCRDGNRIELVTSIAPLRNGKSLETERFYARAVVVAAGFEDKWPDVEVDESAERLMNQYRMVFRYAGNAKGWHVCIRCDGHLHVDQHIALVGRGDYIYQSALGAQDFTHRITILTNGRPHGMSPAVLAQARERRIEIIESKIVRHIGRGTDLLGLELADGTELFFDGFLVDEGLQPNTPFLRGWDVRTDAEGLLVVDDDGQVLDSSGEPVPGLFAAGDIVSGERKQIATAFALGQNAGLAASDSLRQWHSPG